ncbi:hypothetical protein I6N95_03170 [Vagococcus sp. BWB3-3]|uniref:Recombinase family protein n=1 Tax=Vagococcus allomyrinae TaxID=2794353 RepID=A0A940P599_9ENTE|nr:hypothetical protein [Vagococcus allomyrinae]MBP1040006.1 hypothetical protein [Vagococcus allomyrinae]
MKVGYSVMSEDISLFKENGIEHHVIVTDDDQSLLTFKKFLELNKHNQIFLMNIHSIGTYVTLVQLHDVFAQLINEEYSVTILEQGVRASIVNADYLRMVWHLIESEKSAVRNRAKKAIAIAVARGKVVGRPPISQEVVKQMTSLYVKEKRSIREIAAIVGVSSGTVHKYIRLAYE